MAVSTMTDLLERLREHDLPAHTARRLCGEAAAEIERLEHENKRLRTSLERMLNDSMFKDHPEASQMAIDALGWKRL